MRQIREHESNPLNKQVEVWADEQQPDSGTSHDYAIRVKGELPENVWIVHLEFQKGPIAEKGVNGITNEVLLAVLIDRYRGLQSGKFPCRENAITLTKLEEALMWQYKRTRDREARVVEGTNVK
jgi:hypothetical protein